MAKPGKDSQRDITEDRARADVEGLPDVEKKSPSDQVLERPPAPEKDDREAGLQPIYDKIE